MLRVSLRNSGGELDGINARNGRTAVTCAIQLLNETPYLAPGDTLVVTEIDEASESPVGFIDGVLP